MKNYAMRRHARSLTLHVQMKAINRIRRVCVVDDGSQYVSAIFPKPDATWKCIPERLPAISWLCHQSTDPAAVSYLLRAAWHHSSRGRKEIEYHLAVCDKFDSHVRICCTRKKAAEMRYGRCLQYPCLPTMIIIIIRIIIAKMNFKQIGHPQYVSLMLSTWIN